MDRNEIIPLKYGNTNTFYVRGADGGLLVDTDYAGTLQPFFRAIKEKGIGVGDITCMLATHYHPDHTGLAGELQEMGVKLIVMDVQKQLVHYADRLFVRDSRDYVPVNLKKATVIPCGESRKFLKGLGIDGEIVHTPSHSRDSVTLILDSGDAIVGDLEPREYLGAYDDGEAGDLLRDWKEIMRRKPKRIWYGHANGKVV